MQKWQNLELLTRQLTLDALPLNMSKNGVDSSFDHHHYAVINTEGTEQVIFALDGGVETDSRTTNYSIGDDHLPFAQGVIDNVVVACHPQGISARFAIQLETEDQLIIAEIGCILLI